jgi:hypothetical protein
MKTYSFLYLVAGCLLFLTSCKENFLELYPEGQINEQNFYKTTLDFQQAVNGAYVPLRDIANIAFYMDEMRSDNTHYEYNAKDRGGLGYEQLADFLDDAQNGVIATRYQAAYNGISRTNVILDRLAGITFVMADADKKQISGEAKALRAHYYFDLVRHYGAVPLHLHEVKDSRNAYLARSGVDSVYTQIIQDFTDALGLLSAPAKFPASGRVTKGMVATELALVYITRKDYAKAIPLLQSVTTMGYTLLDNYKDVFDPTKKNNAESIFEVQYRTGANDGQSSAFIYRFLPVSPSSQNMLGVNYNNSIGGWNIPTDDLLSQYEPGDKRLEPSIGVVAGHYNSNTDFLPDSIVSINARLPASVIARRFIRKYYHPPYTLPTRTEYNAPENWPVFRYPHALLLLAEALNETGASAQALPYLNQVRKRAGLKDVTATAQADVRAAIDKERRVELAFENYRWLDLVRQDKAIAVMTAFGKVQKEKYGYLLPTSYTVTNNRLVYAIPFREMQLNTKLVQNTGY